MLTIMNVTVILYAEAESVALHHTLTRERGIQGIRLSVGAQIDLHTVEELQSMSEIGTSLVFRRSTFGPLTDSI